MLEQLPSLKVVAVNGVGTDAVDLAYCRERGLPVTATLGALTEDVADLAIGLLIAACRNLCAGDRFVRDGQWELHPQPGAHPAGAPLQRHARGHRRHGPRGPRRRDPGGGLRLPDRLHRPAPMDDVPHRFVPAHRPGARIRRAGAVRRRRQGRRHRRRGGARCAGPRGFLVNVARGRLVNEADLTAALAAGRIAGAGLDVFVDEPRVPPALRQSTT
jgi:hypothetical protein